MTWDKELEQLRYGIFMGASPEDVPALTQEEYVEHYEQLIESDPAAERKLIQELAAPILPLYRKYMEQLAKMEQMISGEEEEVFFSDEEVLDDLYDEVSNLETEEEWQEFKKRMQKNLG